LDIATLEMETPCFADST